MTPSPHPDLGKCLPAACQKEDWDAHFCSPWQRAKRAGHFHWHQPWKRASTHLRERKEKKRNPSLSGNIPWLPSNLRVLVEGRNRKNPRETVPAEEFSDSRPTCGAERMKARSKWETEMVTFAGSKHVLQKR